METLSNIIVHSLSTLSGGQDWRLQLAHERAAHLLIWITRGQGRALVDGMRRGLGGYNTLWIPAGHLFALEMDRQAMGYAVTIPVGTPLRLPEMARHLRILDAGQQSDLASQIEAAQCEGALASPSPKTR